MTIQQILDWKKHFVLAVSYRPDKTELENGFEECVQQLSASQQQQISELIDLWTAGKTDSEKFYFSKKIVEQLQKRPSA